MQTMPKAIHTIQISIVSPNLFNFSRKSLNEHQKLAFLTPDKTEPYREFLNFLPAISKFYLGGQTTF